MAEIRWNQPVMARDQQWLFFSLDDMVPPDHGVRIVNAVLDEVDWTEWEQSYIPTRRGQAHRARTGPLSVRTRTQTSRWDWVSGAAPG